MKSTLTQQELKKFLHYCPLTGLFTRVRGVRGAHKGTIAGSITKMGYVEIGVTSKRYYAHRLAFLYMTGKFPKHNVDHLNRLPHDNRWENLRDVSHSVNMRNRGPSSNNTSGTANVSYDKAKDTWIVRFNDRQMASFKNKEDAVRRRAELVLELPYSPNHGEEI